MWALLLLGLAALIFALPLVPALRELRRATDARPLALGDPERGGDGRARPRGGGAQGELVLEPGSAFGRLSAARIAFGPAAPRDAGARAERRMAALAAARAIRPRGAVRSAGRWLCDGDVEVPAGEVLRGDVVVRGGLTVRRGAAVAGSVKAHGDVRLDPGAAVTGAVVGARAILAAAGCTVGGPILSEQEIALGAGCVVGTPAAPASVVAPLVRVEPGAVVHGTVSARVAGRLSLSSPGSA